MVLVCCCWFSEQYISSHGYGEIYIALASIILPCKPLDISALDSIFPMVLALRGSASNRSEGSAVRLIQSRVSRPVTHPCDLYLSLLLTARRTFRPVLT